jgi:hypothetical protein
MPTAILTLPMRHVLWQGASTSRSSTRRMHEAWLEMFSAVYRVELTETARRELDRGRDDCRDDDANARHAQAISMMREFSDVQAERQLRQATAQRWMAQLESQRAWLNINDEQLAQWRAVFAANDAVDSASSDL